jgi:hypothetical protein
VASPPEGIKRFEPVSWVGDEYVRDSLTVVQAHLMSSSKGIRGSPVTVLTWRQAIAAARYSDSAECVETLPLMGLLRAEGSALPVIRTPVMVTAKAINVDTVAAAQWALSHGIPHALAARW